MEKDAGRVHWLGHPDCPRREELIGVHDTDLRRNLLHIIQAALHHPQAQPHRRLVEANHWIDLAAEVEAGWWATSAWRATSANAIAQWAADAVAEKTAPCHRDLGRAACSPTTSRPLVWRRHPAHGPAPRRRPTARSAPGTSATFSDDGDWRFPGRRRTPDWVQPSSSSMPSGKAGGRRGYLGSTGPKASTLTRRPSGPPPGPRPHISASSTEATCKPGLPLPAGNRRTHDVVAARSLDWCS